MEDSPAAANDAPPRNLVVIGASAGGVETLKRVIAGLPADLPAAICVVLHIAPDSPSALAHILQRVSVLACRPAADGEPLRDGEILVATPDRHLIVEDGHVRLTVGPRENGHRPAVDVLFRSAAAERDSGVVGVILSGNRDDGTAGLAAIKSSGGAVVVQDPADALYAGMPGNALAHVAADAVVPASEIAQILVAIVRGHQLPPDADPSGPHPEEVPGELTSVCPECGGVLTEENHAGAVQWECHVGHRYSPRSLADSQGDRVEMALWTAVRMLRDRAALLERMSEHAEARLQSRSARRFRSQAQDASEQADLVLDALNQAASTTLETVGDEDEDDTGERQAAG